MTLPRSGGNPYSGHVLVDHRGPRNLPVSGPIPECSTLHAGSLLAVPEKHHPTPEERDERVSLPLPPEVAIPALLAVDPEDEPVDDE